MTRTFFALAGKCGGRGAVGRSGDHCGWMGDRSAASKPFSASKAVRATPANPVPPKRRKSRRLSNQRPACAREVFIQYLDHVPGEEFRIFSGRQAWANFAPQEGVLQADPEGIQKHGMN